VTLRRQVDRSGVEVDCKGDHSWDEEESQTKTVQGRDLPIDIAAVTLVNSLGVKNGSAAGERQAAHHSTQVNQALDELTSSHGSPRWLLEKDAIRTGVTNQYRKIGATT
jgi:hypothetical protein